jgi:iron only hydrogenase large subunit-like protein
MPCVKKRPESDEKVFQHGDVRDIDNVLTTRDVGQLLRMRNIDPTELEPKEFDSMFQSEEDMSSLGSGAGQLFGTTGGVMEAAVRTVYAWLTGKQLPRLELTEVRGLEAVKEATVSLLDKETGKGLDTEIRVAVVNGLGNAKRLIQALKNGEVQYDFIEVMACLGGCIGGGGQPRSKDKDILQRRQEVIYKLDRKLPIRQSHENPTVKHLYEKYLGDIGGEKAHHLLHVKPIYGGGDEKS